MNATSHDVGDRRRLRAPPRPRATPVRGSGAPTFPVVEDTRPAHVAELPPGAATRPARPHHQSPPAIARRRGARRRPADPLPPPRHDDRRLPTGHRGPRRDHRRARGPIGNPLPPHSIWLIAGRSGVTCRSSEAATSSVHGARRHDSGSTPETRHRSSSGVDSVGHRLQRAADLAGHGRSLAAQPALRQVSDDAIGLRSVQLAIDVGIEGSTGVADP